MPIEDWMKTKVVLFHHAPKDAIGKVIPV